MMNRSALKQQAKAQLRGNWGWAVGFTFLATIMASLVGGITMGILELMVTGGIAFTFLAFIDNGDKGRGIFDNIFSAFTAGQPMAVFLNTLLSSIFLMLWSLLLVVPGIVKSFSYSQTLYILKDMQESGHKIGATEAISASRALMVGHKWEYFVLQLSFIGWGILTIFTLGIGTLWLSPYIQATNAAYYRKLAGDKFRQPNDESSAQDEMDEF